MNQLQENHLLASQDSKTFIVSTSIGNDFINYLLKSTFEGVGL